MPSLLEPGRERGLPQGLMDPKPLNLYPWQLQAIVESQPRLLPDGTLQRWFGWFCGTGSGKSYGGGVWTLDQNMRTLGRLQFAGQDRPPLGLLVAPTYRMLERHIIGEIDQVTAGTPYRPTYKSQRGELLWPMAAGGGRCYCGSADRPDSLEGPHVDYIWVDEAAMTKDKVWQVILARSTLRKAVVLMTSYWYAPINWCYRKMWRPWQRGDRTRLCFNFPSTANPNYDLGLFEAARRELPPAVFEMRHMGKPTQMAGLVYAGAWGPECLVDAFPVPDTWHTWAGADQGYAPDPFHAGIIAEDPATGNRFVCGEHRANTFLSEQNAARLTRLAYDLNVRPQILYGDPSNKQGLADLRHELARCTLHGTVNPLDIAVRGADNAVEPGIEAVWRQLKTGRLKVMRGRAPALCDEMDLYHRDALGNIVKKDDHGPDMLRYGIYSKAKRSVIVV